MREYLNIMEDVLNNGVQKGDRTGTGTISKFGLQARYDLKKGFPLVTTKKTHLKSIIVELLWFINGDTNIKYLVENNVKIWNEWPYENFKKSDKYNGETMEEFVEKVIASDDFAKEFGELGPVYGKQWRDFNGVDQLEKLIHNIKTNPQSRRLIISAWNPCEVDNMLLPPCHAFMQFYVSENNELSCQLYQRSADIFLGVPFNIASYSVFTMMIAKVCGLKLGEFVHTIGDGHIYSNHIEQCKLQLTREPKKLPTMKIHGDQKDIYSFKLEDFELCDYEAHPHIKGKVAV